jgi:hypothetical protein
MSGHTRWEGIRPRSDYAGREVQMAYLDGYILALEDFLRATADMRVVGNPPPSRRDQVNKESGSVQHHKALRRQAGQMLHEARATLALLRSIPTEGTQ